MWKVTGLIHRLGTLDPNCQSDYRSSGWHIRAPVSKPSLVLGYRALGIPANFDLQLPGIVSAFLAYGILHMRGINGLPGWACEYDLWRTVIPWYPISFTLTRKTSGLFALEGTLTGLIGIVSYFYLPPSPCQTASYFRGKDGWFNEREEKIMVYQRFRAIEHCILC